MLEVKNDEDFEEGSPVTLVKPKKVNGPDMVTFRLSSRQVVSSF
jgi:hypothetical protein